MRLAHYPAIVRAETLHSLPYPHEWQLRLYSERFTRRGTRGVAWLGLRTSMN